MTGNLQPEQKKEKNKRNIDLKIKIYTGFSLLLIAVLLILILVLFEVSLELQQAVMVIIGLVTFAALNAIGSGLEDTDVESLILNKTLVARTQNIQYNYLVQREKFAEAAEEIQQLLDQLSQTNPTTTIREKMTVVAEAVDQIENNLTLKEKVINVLKAGEVEVLKEAIDNPLTSILMATIEGWRESDEYIGIRD